MTLERMIAAVAWRNKATPLAQDADLDHVRTVVRIALDRPSSGV
jgi:hypothetical protein